MLRGCSEAAPRSYPFDSTETGGNVYDKYGTSNPIARRLMAGFMSQLDELVERTGAREAHEVGCGEGELAIRLARRGIRMRGTDAFPQVLEEARRRAETAGVEIDFEASAGRDPRPRSPCRRADRLLRGARAPRGPGARARGPGRPGSPVADRERPPRAALARAQPGAALLRRRARQHPRPPEPLVQARLRAVSHAPVRGNRDAGARLPGPWPSAAYNRRLHEASATRCCESAARPPGRRRRGRPRRRLGTRHAPDGLGPDGPLQPGAGPRQGPGADRPVALGHQRQGLGRRPLLLGEEPRHGRAHHSALCGDRGTGRRQARPRRGRQRAAHGPSQVDPGQRHPARELRLRRGPRAPRAADPRAVDADRLGPHPARGGVPRDPAAARGALGGGPLPARLRHRRGDHPRPGDGGDDLRRRSSSPT